MSYRPLPQPDTVQLNINVTHEFREHLRRIAFKEGRSLSRMVRTALEKEYPMKGASTR